MNSKTIKKILYYLLHAIGFVLLYLVIKDFDWGAFAELFEMFTISDFIIGFSILLMVYVIKSVRWMLINRTFGIHVNYPTTLIFFLASGFLSVITPGRIGEFAKIYFLKRKTGISGMLATSSVILDRVWDVFVLTLLGGISFLLVIGNFSANKLTLALILVFFIASMIIIIYPDVVFKPFKRVFRKKEKLIEEADQVFQLWRKNVVKLFIPGISTSLIAFLGLSFIPIIFSTRLGQDVAYMQAVSAVSLSNILAFLPVTVAGFGTRELVFSEIWKIMEYGAESAITISTAYFICNYIGSLIFGGLTYLFWFRKHFRLKEIKEKQL